MAAASDGPRHHFVHDEKHRPIWMHQTCAQQSSSYYIKLVQKTYYSEQIDVNTGDKNNMWKALRHIMGSPHKSAPNHISPESFNDYFSSIGTKLHVAESMDNVQYSSSQPRAIYSFELHPKSVDFIFKQWLLIKERNNCDVLNINSKLLRLGAGAIAPSLTVIFNISISSGDLPADWKYAKVTPIFKGKGAIDDCGNYRPISVISHISKIMEKAVLFQLK